MNFFRQRADNRSAEAKAELDKSKHRLAKARAELDKRMAERPDTLKRQARMEQILQENHLADLMFEALSEKRN